MLSKSKAITVSEITSQISRTLETGFSDITVQGEISNFKQHSSGHRYFSLKDAAAQISCIMWRSRMLSFEPEDGMKVVIRGSVTVFPPRGNYQIDCISMSPLGMGDLYLAYEKLKKDLAEAGYFAEERKRRIPLIPMKIGISTSPTGAAVKDMFSTLQRRLPFVEIVFRPTQVQGDNSEYDIANAISELNKSDVDLIIIGRGGGSLEDLWAFNTRTVADAIYKSAIPIISAVGHETDITISDFTADIRAATPTAAAEIASSFPVDDICETLDLLMINMKSSLGRRLENAEEKLVYMTKGGIAKRLVEKLKLAEQQIDESEMSMKRSAGRLVKDFSERVKYLETNCRALNPLSPLEKGFAILYSDKGIIKAGESLAGHKKVLMRRLYEEAVVRVQKINPNTLFE